MHRLHQRPVGSSAIATTPTLTTPTLMWDGTVDSRLFWSGVQLHAGAGPSYTFEPTDTVLHIDTITAQ